MCVFKKELEGKEIDCNFSKIDYLVGLIPLDEQGLCIFHSENKTWKNENNFSHHLGKLISYFEEDALQKKIFLEDVIFIGNIENLFNNKEFKKDISFKYSQFNENIVFSSSTFKNLNFCSVVFKESVFFTNVFVKNMRFDEVQFNSKLLITESNFLIFF